MVPSRGRISFQSCTGSTSGLHGQSSGQRRECISHTRVCAWGCGLRPNSPALELCPHGQGPLEWPAGMCEAAYSGMLHQLVQFWRDAGMSKHGVLTTLNRPDKVWYLRQTGLFDRLGEPEL